MNLNREGEYVDETNHGDLLTIDSHYYYLKDGNDPYETSK